MNETGLIKDSIIDVINLIRIFGGSRQEKIRAVDDASFQVRHTRENTAGNSGQDK